MSKGMRSKLSLTKLRFSRTMRNNPTKAEAFAWKNLRRKELGFRFHRQCPILGWIVDFYCPAAKLVLEVDGPNHDEANDRKRAFVMFQKLGIKTVRFTNEEVLETWPAVKKKLCTELLSRAKDPTRVDVDGSKLKRLRL